MKIDLTCPAEVRRCELPKEDYPACDLVTYNLSDRVIVSVEVTLILSNKGEGEERLIYRAHGLHGEPGAAFTVPVPIQKDTKADSAEAVIEKVWYDDNSVWRRGKGALTEYTSNALPNSRSLETLRYVAGADAVGYPQEQDGLWLCVCGRPNLKSAHTCVRCQRDREQVFTQYNREAIEKQADQRERQLNLKAKAAREDASRLQLEREKEYQLKKKKRRRTMSIVVAAAVCLCAAYGVIFHLLPYLNYQSAVGKLEAGSWKEAQAAFADMGDYRDAAELLKECQYQAAKADLESGDEAVIAAAGETLAALGDYEDAADLVKEADYARAAVLMEAGRLEEATDLFESLGDYKDSADQIRQCAYLAADVLLESGQYDEARKAFEALADMDGANEKIEKAIYLSGREAVESGDAETAISLLDQVSDYEDAAELLKKAHYMKGESLRDGGSLEEAGEEFFLAGDYEDAVQQAGSCMYAPAIAAMNEGDYIRAAELFGKILGYEDAEVQWQACVYQQVLTAMKDTEYAMARGLLDQLPDDYEDVAEKRLECTYLAAVASSKRGEYQAAIDSFTQLGDYKDSADQLLAAQYGLAESLAKNGSYSEAIAMFQSLGDYSDSADKVKETSYQEAVALTAAGSYDEAILMLSAIEGYQGVEDALKEAQYLKAVSLLDAGDYTSARPIFEELGDYSEAKDKLSACDYALAADLASQGQTQEAAELYETIAGYEDATAQAQALYYTLAEQAKAEGDVLKAGRYYDKAGDTQDAAEQAAACYDAYYGETATAAQAALDSGNYAEAVELLSSIDLTDLPKQYAILAQRYQEANYQEAERLYAEDKPYEALPYYRAIPNYKNVSDRLQRSCYLILGQWRSTSGEIYIFREDGTCNLNGEELCFSVSVYSMTTGATQDSLKATHRVSSVNEKNATIYDLRNGETKRIRLTRIDEAEASQEPENDEETLPELDEGDEQADAVDELPGFVTVENEP